MKWKRSFNTMVKGNKLELSFTRQETDSCLVAKLCQTLCVPMDYNSPGSSVHGISQARILEWVAISFSRGSSWFRDWTWISCIGRRILYHWVIREAQEKSFCNLNSYFYPISGLWISVHAKSLSCVWLFATLWTIALHALLSMGFCRQEYWSGLPLSSPVDLPHPGIEPMSLMCPALAGRFFTTNATWEVNFSRKAWMIHLTIFFSVISTKSLMPSSGSSSDGCFRRLFFSMWNISSLEMKPSPFKSNTSKQS